jgi:hypothetical protein
MAELPSGISISTGTTLNLVESWDIVWSTDHDSDWPRSSCQTSARIPIPTKRRYLEKIAVAVEQTATAIKKTAIAIKKTAIAIKKTAIAIGKSGYICR